MTNAEFITIINSMLFPSKYRFEPVARTGMEKCYPCVCALHEEDLLLVSVSQENVMHVKLDFQTWLLSILVLCHSMPKI